MQVSVAPAEFQFVFFDASDIQVVAEGLLDRMALTDYPLEIVVDETTPLNRVRIFYADGIRLDVESGAFEDTRRPRRMSTVATATTIGRALFRIRDRIDGTFAKAPDEDELDLAHVAAWDAYCLGRFAQLGVHHVNQQRWRYNFRNRHGFSDGSDEVFDALWSSQRLTWSELQAMSERAQAATSAVGV
jgi:hypothetical protein